MPDRLECGLVAIPTETFVLIAANMASLNNASDEILLLDGLVNMMMTSDLGFTRLLSECNDV